MREIELNGGYIALVDDDDFERISSRKWYIHKRKNGKVSGVHTGNHPDIKMHRMIMNAKKGQIIDHTNRNPLDNRKKNLRFATGLDNHRNRIFHNRLGLRGVVEIKDGRLKKWRANIRIGGKPITLGYFFERMDAAICYDMASLMWHGEFGHTNILKTI